MKLSTLKFTCMATIISLGVIELAYARDFEWHKIEGMYEFFGSELSEPSKGTANNTHLYLKLTGSSAQKLYTSINTKELPDECIGGNVKIKKVENMLCRKFPLKKYECVFSIDIQNQKIEAGEIC